jgi:thiol-disulfide isomerase/thioredoxin
VGKVDQFVKKGSDVFILVYMEGCGPCNATRPEWAKIESALKDQYAKNNTLVVIDVNKDFLSI